MKKLWGIFAFASAVAVLIVAMKIVNWVPSLAQPDLLKKYRNLDEVKTGLNMRDIIIPSYFPQNLKWPPSTILAQGKPFQAVVMEFEQDVTKDTSLVISQSLSENFRADGKIRLVQLKEKVNYSLKGRNVVLEVGFGSKGEMCSRVFWKEGKYWVHVMSKSPPMELLKVAESMIQ
ncbi:MAG: hypothetical protein HW377_295 [Actinobacteria bacterium]|nr:hypothetical protein [Actinomycetota bacterium]